MQQARRPRGQSGAVSPKSLLVPPQTRILPPKRGLCPKESNRLGDTEVQFEARNSQDTCYHPRIREHELFFADFIIKTLFFWVSPRNSWKFAHFLNRRAFFCLHPKFVKILAYFEMKTFFFGLYSRFRGISR